MKWRRFFLLQYLKKREREKERKREKEIGVEKRERLYTKFCITVFNYQSFNKTLFLFLKIVVGIFISLINDI